MSLLFELEFILYCHCPGYPKDKGSFIHINQKKRAKMIKKKFHHLFFKVPLKWSLIFDIQFILILQS